MPASSLQARIRAAVNASKLRDDADWNGVPVRVWFKVEDGTDGFGGSQAIERRATIMVDMSMVALPAIDDVVVIHAAGGDRTFHIRAEPMANGRGEWVCNAEEV